MMVNERESTAGLTLMGVSPKPKVKKRNQR